MSAGQGKPGDDNPLKVCRDLGLANHGGMSDLSWAHVLDLAVAAYWERRPDPPSVVTVGAA